MKKDLYWGWWRWACFLIIPLEGQSLSDVIWNNCCLQTLTMLLIIHLLLDKPSNLSYSASGSRVWTWATSVIETTLQACDWNLFPGLLKPCLTLSKLKNSNKSLSLCLLVTAMARTWTSLSLVAPCTSISQCSSQARKDEAGIIPSAANLSSALLQSGSWGKETGAQCH